jgi:hypothetical protein
MMMDGLSADAGEASDRAPMGLIPSAEQLNANANDWGQMRWANGDRKEKIKSTFKLKRKRDIACHLTKTHLTKTLGE